MTNSDIIVLEIVRQMENKDIQATLLDYESFNTLLVEFVDALNTQKMEMPFWQPYFETHLYKFALLNSSLMKEFEGITLQLPDNNKEYKTHNVSALHLLGRANIETFLLIKYLYLNIKHDSQGMFRYALYEWSGLNTRQKFPAIHPDNIEKKSSEKLVIAELENKIKGNLYFQSLPASKQNFIIKNKKAKEIDWKEILDESNLDSSFHHNNWKYYSNYAHCEQIEAMQLKELFQNPQIKHENVYLILNSTIIYEAILLTDLKNKYKQFELIYNNQTLHLQTKIAFWAKLGAILKMPA